MHLTIDIETVSDWQGDSFPPIPEHRPCVISALRCERGKYDLHSWQIHDESAEVEALKWLERSVRDRSEATVISWNGRGFDLPVLGLRAMTLGVPWVNMHAVANGYRFGYCGDLPKHVDLLDQLGNYGACRALPLAGVLESLGLPVKRDLDGSMVGEAWRNGEYDRVERYCCEDVIGSWLAYLRFEQTHRGTNVDKLWSLALDYARGHRLLKSYVGELEAAA